ncbi:hypothetical protein LXL04_023742 [Taraxacum kok-saghyz]
MEADFLDFGDLEDLGAIFLYIPYEAMDGFEDEPKNYQTVNCFEKLTSGAKNRSNTSPVVKKISEKTTFFFPKRVFITHILKGEMIKYNTKRSNDDDDDDDDVRLALEIDVKEDNHNTANSNDDVRLALEIDIKEDNHNTYFKILD